jgi:hypothetical protein
VRPVAESTTNEKVAIFTEVRQSKPLPEHLVNSLPSAAVIRNIAASKATSFVNQSTMANKDKIPRGGKTDSPSTRTRTQTRLIFDEEEDNDSNFSPTRQTQSRSATPGSGKRKKVEATAGEESDNETTINKKPRKLSLSEAEHSAAATTDELRAHLTLVDRNHGYFSPIHNNE